MPIDYLIICSVALLASGLTFFSGFGLGTVLMPAFALFFAVPVAVAATAVVHLANNLFKLVLIGRAADRAAVLRFALPAAVTAVFGAALLTMMDNLPAMAAYEWGGRLHQITPVKLVIGLLIVIFALFDLVPQLVKMEFSPRWLPVGGALSGFFGGLSGNQGALRSAFLIKAGLSKEAFIGTGVVAAVIVDVVRLFVYGLSFYSEQVFAAGAQLRGPVAAAALSAFAGAFIGKRLLNKVTLRGVQLVVGILLILLGAGLAAGIL